MPPSLQTSQVEHIVQQGWRRRMLVLAVDQSAIGLAVVFAGFALLILLGTQILAWPWLLGIAAIGIGLSVLGVRRRISDAYSVAQMMDRHLDLKDSLSTAWFLQTNTDAQDKTAAAYQLHRAEELAQTADPAAAFPFQRQRSWLVTAALGLLAVGLFSARYLVTRELNLQHTFLPLAVTQVIEYVRHGLTDSAHDEQAADAGKSKGLPPSTTGKDAEHRPPAPKPEQGQTPSQEQAKGGDSNSKSNQSPDPNAQPAKNAEGQSGENKRNGEGEGSKNGNQEAGNKPPSDQSQQQQQEDAKQQENGGQQHSASMMDRMRDALSSVMSKMKPSGNPQESQSAAQKNADGQKGADQSSSKDQNGDGQKESGKEQSAQEQSSGQQQGQGSAKAQAAGKDSAQASDKKGSDAQSGVGHSDGDKDVKAAEQAKAMGKLAEIIGKRSASLTGDMQIEPSGKQRLQTGYTHQQGQHADLGGEINRDEVPVEDQEYVREYMELVRKKPLKGTSSH